MKRSAVCASLLSLLAACSAPNPFPSSHFDSGEGQGGGAQTGSGGGGAGDEMGGGVDFTGGGGAGGGDACAGTTVAAELVPLDMYIMLDRSGSMNYASGAGPSKWSAVTQALESFFADPASEGIGVGLQYFPIHAAGAPNSCSNDAACGAFGPCLMHVCSGDATTYCGGDDDCKGIGTCVPLGRCANDDSVNCAQIGAACAGDKGACVAATKSSCAHVASCKAADYAAPAVPMQSLGGAAAALSASIAETTPIGTTPTSAALQGAHDYARQWALTHPDHTVVTVLVTDGMPTECAPKNASGIAAIAAEGLSADPSVATFVVGVFNASDKGAEGVLDQIAAAGGSGDAFMIDAGKDVHKAFLDALNAIRGNKLTCEYQVPAAPAGQSLDYAEVNVEHLPAGASTPNSLYYVGAAESCDPQKGGWYYDVDPAKGTPTKIEICPASCGAFGFGGEVRIRLGCATAALPPPR